MSDEKAACRDESKQGYVVIWRGLQAAILLRQANPHHPYVVAWGYDEAAGDWSHGSYHADLVVALREATE